ncbi:hypothetical protein BGZ73_005436 [Actinomortierella ambigua]|nr:hypothetical protein BGZ73_005436 [Actinomortierella ambigua]
MKLLSTVAVLAAVLVTTQAKPWRKPIWGEIEFCGRDDHDFKVWPGECKMFHWHGKVCDLDVPHGVKCKVFSDGHCWKETNWHHDVRSIKCWRRWGGGGDDDWDSVEPKPDDKTDTKPDTKPVAKPDTKPATQP